MCAGVHEQVRSEVGVGVGVAAALSAGVGAGAEFGEVTVVPVATAGACNPPCTTIFPFLVLLFFMTFVVAVTQMPLLMIVLRCATLHYCYITTTLLLPTATTHTNMYIF